MLTALVRLSVRHPIVVLALGAAVLLYGIVVASSARYDVFPEFAPPEVSVQTEAPGLAPEQVEVLVTTPIEQVINGTAGVANVRSQSIQGFSDITVVFADGTNIYRARELVSERLDEVARRLPQTIPSPIITPLTASTGIALVIGLTSGTRSLRDVRTVADWTLRPQLLAVRGVASVSVTGGDVRQIQIQPDPARLAAHDLGLADLVTAAKSATGLRGAGVLDNANERVIVSSDGQMSTPALIAQTAVRTQGGAVLRLGDLAHVADGAAPRIGAGAVGDTEGVVISVNAQLGANIREVATAVEQALAVIAPAIRAEGMTLHPALFRPANFIDLALHNATQSLVIGGLLVAIVLVLFLADFGTIVVSLTAIPLSLLAALIALSAFGYSINTLVLGGLAIAIGEVVDDAIIDVENIARRLRENRTLPAPRPTADVVIDASLEVRSSVVYATFVVVLVFVPLVTLTGVHGAMFRPLGLAYACAILASLIVALTVTPAFTLLVLARRDARAEDPPLLRWLKGRYVAVLSRLEVHPWGVMATTAALVIGAALMIPFFGGGFLPTFNEGHFRLHMSALPGTSIDESLRIGRQATDALRGSPAVRSVAQRVGRAELSEDTFGPHYSEFEVDVLPENGRAAQATEDDIRRRLRVIPGVNFQMLPYLTERIEEVLTGTDAPVVVKLFGNDLDSIDVAAHRVQEVIEHIRGATDVAGDLGAVSPRALIRLKPAALATFGIPADDALAAVETATEGTTVAQVFDGNRSTDVVVVLDPARRQRTEDLAAIPVTSSLGATTRMVRLGQLAMIARVEGRYAIAHEGARRLQTVSAGVTGRDVRSFTTDLTRRLSAVALPRGVYADVGGSAAAQSAAERELFVRDIFTAIGILLLLSLAFRNARSLLLVLANLPFALVGGVIAVAATGAVVSLGSLVGFVTLFGISMRNAIMLISHYQHLIAAEGERWGPATAIRGASERLGPILMTALVTGLGLLPLALGSGDPGREIDGPPAIVILGGLVTSTALSLFVLPTLALRFGRFSQVSLPRLN